MDDENLKVYLDILRLFGQVIPQDLTAAFYGDPLALDRFEDDCERLARTMIKLKKVS